jgi:hypothetical protein
MHRMAQTCVGMKLQHHIDALSVHKWPRPSYVTLSSGTLRCELGNGRYALQDSYRLSPHAQFLNARNDSEMCAFVKAWGPLYLHDGQRNSGIATFPLREFHAERRWLAALLGMFTSIESASAERESLQEFIEAAVEGDRCSASYDPNVEAFPLVQLRSACNVQESLSEWAAQATIGEIRSAVQFVVESYSPTLAPFSGLRVVREGRKSILKFMWALPDLQTALRWMVWYDFARRDPLYCCDECHRFFRSESKHARKFCGEVCAKKVSARNWRKKDLKKKRLAKEANKEKRETNVTHKTR